MYQVLWFGALGTLWWYIVSWTIWRLFLVRWVRKCELRKHAGLRRHLASNERVQRTRLRTPLTRRPLGRKAVWALAVGALGHRASIGESCRLHSNRNVEARCKDRHPAREGSVRSLRVPRNGKFRYDELFWTPLADSSNCLMVSWQHGVPWPTRHLPSSPGSILGNTQPKSGGAPFWSEVAPCSRP